MAGDDEERRGMRRRQGPSGVRDLRDRTAVSPVRADLPLVHATATFWAGEILRAGKLETRKCPVFGREMVYFFVLRPDYRNRHGSEKSHQINRFPVVFVLRSAVAERPLHVYPFDTGAAYSGAFAEQADPLIYLDDYELEPTLAAATRHIAWAFGSLGAYYEGTMRQDVLAGVPQYDTVTRGFVDVANMGRLGSNRHDRRASAVEVAAGGDVHLKDNVLLAILPKQYLEDETGPNSRVIARLSHLGIPYETYDWRPNVAPDEFQEEISELVRAFLARGGWL